MARKKKKKISYQDYINGPVWKKKRQKRLLIDDFTCQGCGITQDQLQEIGRNSLQVHHKNGGPPDFKYPAPLGRESPEKHLITLCESCHDGVTDSVRKQRFSESTTPPLEKVSFPVSPVFVLETSTQILPLPNAQDTQGSAQWTLFDSTQRSSSRPSEFIFQSDQVDLWETEKDRCRPRRDGTSGVSGIALYQWTRSNPSGLPD